VYPPGGQPGEELRVRFLGDAGGELIQTTRLPNHAKPSFGLSAEQNGQFAPSANPFRLSQLPNILEHEPNDDIGRATPSNQALPVAFNGIISKAGDADCFRFSAQKSEVYDVQVYARQLRSPLDSILTLFNAEGEIVASNDDSGDHDSALRFTCPADGDYIIRVTDHLGAGGPDWTYRVEIAPPHSSLALTLPMLSKNSQDRQTVGVPRGGRVATVFEVRRENYSGAVAIKASDLPQGVTLSARPIDAGLHIGPALWTAAGDAPLGCRLAELGCRSESSAAKVEGEFEQGVNLLFSATDNAIYHQVTVDRLAIAVIEEAPFEVSLLEPKAALVPDGAISLKVRVARKTGFNGPISLAIPFLPPWFEAPPTVDVPADQNEGTILVKAASEAEPRDWKLLVQGQAMVENRPVWVASQFATIHVEPPRLALKIEPVTLRQGQTTRIVGRLVSNPGPAAPTKIRLMGLPSRVKSAEAELSPDGQTVAFSITADATAPLGEYRSLYCEAELPTGAEHAVQYLGRGATLRIDPSGGAAVDSSGRRLSALELLRKQQAAPAAQTR
jgi:hypothetical protein